MDTLTITPASDFEYRENAGQLYGSAEIRNGGITGSFSAPSGGEQVFLKVVSVSMSSQAEADRFARGILRDINKGVQTGILWSGELLRNYAPGSMVELVTEGVPSWNGPAFISRIRHDYVKMRSKLYLRKPLEGY